MTTAWYSYHKYLGAPLITPCTPSTTTSDNDFRSGSSLVSRPELHALGSFTDNSGGTTGNWYGSSCHARRPYCSSDTNARRVKFTSGNNARQSLVFDGSRTPSPPSTSSPLSFWSKSSRTSSNHKQAFKISYASLTFALGGAMSRSEQRSSGRRFRSTTLLLRESSCNARGACPSRSVSRARVPHILLSTSSSPRCTVSVLST